MKILLTGSSRGIGLELSRMFLEKNDFVIGIARSPSKIAHVNYKHYCIDLTNEDEVRNVFRENPNIDIVINNAAIAEKNHLLLTGRQSIYNILDTNLIAPIIITKEYSKACISNKAKGEIINFSSIATNLSIPGECIYTVTKKALEEFSKQASCELAQFNISISAIKLGLFDIGLSKNISTQDIEGILKNTQLKKISTPDDLFNLLQHIIFLNPETKNGRIFDMDLSL